MELIFGKMWTNLRGFVHLHLVGRRVALNSVRTLSGDLKNIQVLDAATTAPTLPFRVRNIDLTQPCDSRLNSFSRLIFSSQKNRIFQNWRYIEPGPISFSDWSSYSARKDMSVIDREYKKPFSLFSDRQISALRRNFQLFLFLSFQIFLVLFLN